MQMPTQDDFNRQVDETMTRLEASAVACEIVAQHVVRSMWPWQRWALRQATSELNPPYTSQPHRHEVAKQAKALILRWSS